MANSDHAQVKALPPLVYFSAVLAGWLLHKVLPLPVGLERAPQEIATWALMGPALALLLWAMGNFRRAGTAINPYRTTTTVVGAGPYRFSRNPMYVSMALLQASFAFMLDTWWILVLLPPVMLFMRHAVIGPEERYLEGKFGADYLAYKQRVRRWL